MTKIVGFSGKKGSGKNTCCNFLVGSEMQSLGLIKSFVIGDDGQLYCQNEGMNENEFIRFDPLSRNIETKMWMKQNLDEYIKVYSLSGWLKMIAVELLQLPEELVYGNQKQKDELSNLTWENFPVPHEYLTNSNLRNQHKQLQGKMSIRQVLQFLGTDILRSISQTIWTDRLLKDIEKEKSKLALVCDIRFLDEAKNLQKNGVKIIRLTRRIDDDFHKSETDLDNYDKFDAIIDNKNLIIPEQNKMLYNLLKSWDYLEYDIMEIE